MLPNDARGLGFALVTAVVKNDVQMVHACLEAKADIHFQEDLPLRSAAFTGHFDILKLLVDKGADIHAVNDEALLYAAKSRDSAMTLYLIEKGADVKNMLQKHRKDVDADCIATLDGLQGEKDKGAFSKNFDQFSKNRDKFKAPAFKDGKALPVKRKP